tara:strand:+ start:177 stop:716 length:540 start_codon:yes stop_codon:yes gene_type:complete
MNTLDLDNVQERIQTHNLKEVILYDPKAKGTVGPVVMIGKELTDDESKKLIEDSTRINPRINRLTYRTMGLLSTYWSTVKVSGGPSIPNSTYTYSPDSGCSTTGFFQQAMTSNPNYPDAPRDSETTGPVTSYCSPGDNPIFVAVDGLEKEVMIGDSLTRTQNFHRIVDQVAKMFNPKDS